MENFNTTRFANYAKWDLTINRKFYRNMFVVLGIAILSITIISFALRWLMFAVDESIYTSDRLWKTSLYIVCAVMIGMEIMSACILHPMRNKQGRITHITLPATPSEKYTWHVLICMGGTIIASLVAIAVSDGINALLSYLVMGPQGTGWLFGEYLSSNYFSLENIMSTYTGNLSFQSSMTGDDIEAIKHLDTFFSYCWPSIITGMILETGFYALFNSIIYKYNLPISYIIQQVISIIFAIIIIVVLIIIGNYTDTTWETNTEALTIFNILSGWMLFCCIFSAITGIACWIGAYHLYKKAQLTNRFNH